MAQARDAVAFIWSHYPDLDEMIDKNLQQGISRLIQMVYLVDWRSILTRNNHPMTGVQWEYHPAVGPYSEEVVTAILRVIRGKYSHGGDRDVTRETNYPSLTESDKAVSILSSQVLGRRVPPSLRNLSLPPTPC